MLCMTVVDSCAQLKNIFECVCLLLVKDHLHHLLQRLEKQVSKIEFDSLNCLMNFYKVLVLQNNRASEC